MKTFTLIRKGQKLGRAELLKKCSCSTGYEIILFRLIEDRILPYIVAVKKGDEVVEFKQMFKGAFTYYLDMICCYA